MTKIKVGITPPKNISRKKFDKWLDSLQSRVTELTDSESKAIEELLDNAFAAKVFNGGSFNYNVNEQIKSTLLPEHCSIVVNEFMKHGYLQTLYTIIQERKIKQMITDDVNKADAVFKAKGYIVDGDFWKKKVWKPGGFVYQLTIIGRDLEEKTHKYLKAVALFGKDDVMIEEFEPVYSAYLLDLMQ